MRNRWAFGVLLGLLASLTECAADGVGATSDIQPTSTLLWPMHVSIVPVSCATRKSLDTPDLARGLSQIGLDGFEKFVKLLPAMLEADPAFHASFAVADHSRTNLAFRNWQLLSQANYTGSDPMGLAVRGEVLQYTPGVEYSFLELYEDPLYERLLSRINQLSRLYLVRTGYDKEALPSKFRVVTWVEVLKKGDAFVPITRTDGAYLAGRFFAQFEEGAIKFQFEDQRGINPPFGKTHAYTPYEGSMIMHPTWSSTFTTPSLSNEPLVMVCFLVYPPDGKMISWKEDLTGRLEVERKIQPAGSKKR
mmetsp:Transcript_65368/g.121860  ORF Transcript_65368/g.121860 Transcript_65368/m.121860 type:complete len:306 (+) Transcript_65368:53-970(+)